MARKPYDPYDYVKSRVPKFKKVDNVVLFLYIYFIDMASSFQNIIKIIARIDSTVDVLLYDKYNWNEKYQHNDLILMPTANGLGIGFHPDIDNDEILEITVNIFQKIKEGNGNIIRIGIAKGVNVRYLDVNGMNNLFGEGVNAAYGLMNAAEKDQIIVNAEFAQEIKNSSKIKELIHIGSIKGSRGVSIDIHEIRI
jgi:hypothetical protein